MKSSLCLYLTSLLSQARSTIVPGRKALCVRTHIGTCVWFDTEITEKELRYKGKRLERRTPGDGDKENWRRASVCKRLGETQRDRLSIYKRDCTSNFADSPGFLTESCTHSSTMSRICANRFHFTELVCPTKSSLEHPAWFPRANMDRFAACPFLIFTHCSGHKMYWLSEA